MDGVNAFFFVIAMLCVFSGLVLSFFKISVARQRRVYWRCAVLGAVAGFFCGYPDVGKGVGAAALVIFAMILGAVRATPYLKIGGKIYAFSAADRRARDDDVPGTLQEDLAHAADLIQRRFGDPDLPDTTGRNVTEAWNALNWRSGGEGASASNERNAPDPEGVSVGPSNRAAPRERIAAPSGVEGPRLMYFSVGLTLTAGGVLMAVNPPPPVRSPHTITSIGVLCAVLGIYLIVKAMRVAAGTAQQPTVSAGSGRAPRHAAATSRVDSAKECAPLLGAGVVGAGFLWWGHRSRTAVRRRHRCHRARPDPRDTGDHGLRQAQAGPRCVSSAATRAGLRLPGWSAMTSPPGAEYREGAASIWKAVGTRRHGCSTRYTKTPRCPT
jgi:hypothetical protein